MWGRERKGGQGGGERLAVIKSHFNLSKKKCSYQISYCPQLVVSSPLSHLILSFFFKCLSSWTIQILTFPLIENDSKIITINNRYNQLGEMARRCLNAFSASFSLTGAELRPSPAADQSPSLNVLQLGLRFTRKRGKEKKKKVECFNMN